MERMEPTTEQLRTFFEVVRQAVQFSSYVSYVELPPDGSLYVYTKRYDEPLSSIVIRITPNGQFSLLPT
jgi:hypothetical protein